VIVAEMQLTRRPHSGKNSFGLRMAAHVKRRSIRGLAPFSAPRKWCLTPFPA
jgi:hypothetical protein